MNTDTRNQRSPAGTGNRRVAPGPKHGCPQESSLLRPARRGVTESRLRGLVRGTGGRGGHCAGVRLVAGGRPGAGALDRRFGEVHRDTYADGVALFCNTNRRGGSPAMGEKGEEEAREGVNYVGMGIKQTRKRGARRKG